MPKQMRQTYANMASEDKKRFETEMHYLRNGFKNQRPLDLNFSVVIPLDFS